MDAALADVERLRDAKTLESVQQRGAAQQRYLDALKALKIFTSRSSR
jgi:hypothetical protein